MNNADEKRLKKDPRYQRIISAHAAMSARIEAAQREIEAAKEAFSAASPELFGVRGSSLDERVFNAIRPKGDKVRVVTSHWTGCREIEAEIENVTAARVSLVGHDRPFRDGYLRGQYGGASYKIHEDDLARIKAGELKGWRQKPWATEERR
jgi:hypothetical protein